MRTTTISGIYCFPDYLLVVFLSGTDTIMLNIKQNAASVFSISTGDFHINKCLICV